VTKLASPRTQADKRSFGEKDYQQLQVVTRWPAIWTSRSRSSVAPTIREEDGLAMSRATLMLSDRAPYVGTRLHRAMEDYVRGARRGGILKHCARWQ